MNEQQHKDFGFTYSPLTQAPRTTRLLKILPPNGDGCIHCSLEEATLDDCDYVALSHVWGNSLKTCKIVINQKDYRIRPQLWSFLHFAQTNLLGVNIWIDAISINQDDLAEKSSQIPLMGLIFSRAQKVYAWLIDGHGIPHASGSSDSTINAAQKLGTAVSKPDSREELVAHAESIAGALIRLLVHEFWSRVWIIQELTLARAVEFRWLSITIPWDLLRSFIASVFDTDNRDVLAKAISLTFETNEWLAKPLPVQDFFKSTDTQKELVDLVVRYENHACSIKSDHVFGLLGLADEVHEFRADYGDSPTALIAKVILSARRSPTNEQLEVLRRLLLGNATAPYLFGTFDLDVVSQKLDGADINICSRCKEVTNQSHEFWTHAARITTEPIESFIIFRKPTNIMLAVKSMTANSLRQATKSVIAIAIRELQTPGNPQPELHLLQVPSNSGRIRLIGDIRDGIDIRHVALKDNWLALAVLLVLIKATSSELRSANCDLARSRLEDLFEKKCQEHNVLRHTDSELGQPSGNKSLRLRHGLKTLV